MTPRNRRSKLHDIQQIADSLRVDTPIGADGSDVPDFTDAIMLRVHAQRPFLTRRTRRLVVACRYGAASAAVLTIGGIALVQTTSPRITSLAAPIQPITFSPAVDSVRNTTAQAVNTVRRGLREMSTLTDPARNNSVLASYVDRLESQAPSTGTLLDVSPVAHSPQVRVLHPTFPSGALSSAGGDDLNYYSVYPGITSDSPPSRFASLKSRPLTMYSPEPYSLRPVTPPICSLLDDFPMVITGQPASDGFVPQ